MLLTFASAVLKSAGEISGKRCERENRDFELRFSGNRNAFHAGSFLSRINTRTIYYIAESALSNSRYQLH